MIILKCLIGQKLYNFFKDSIWIPVFRLSVPLVPFLVNTMETTHPFSHSNYFGGYDIRHPTIFLV